MPPKLTTKSISEDREDSKDRTVLAFAPFVLLVLLPLDSTAAGRPVNNLNKNAGKIRNSQIRATH